MLEFSDMPMKPPKEEDNYYGYFPAKYISSYLEDYTKSHSYDNKTIFERVIFKKRVSQVQKRGGLWITKCESTDAPFESTRLIVASGLTSKPKMPNYPGISTLKRPIVHQMDFGKSNIMSSPDIKNVVVLGGGKSAADLVYGLAKAGKSVTWLIRQTGCGPAFFIPAQGAGRYRNANEMFFTGKAGAMSMSIFFPWRIVQWLFHSTRWGMNYVNKMWEGADQGNRLLAGYKTRESNGKGFEKLEPDTPIFWENDSTGTNQRPDFWETIAEKVHVYRQDITSMTDGTIKLHDGTVLTTDALVCGTGWESTFDYFSTSEAAKLGLSVPIDAQPSDIAAKWEKLEAEADSKVVKMFPRLASPPSHFKRPLTATPYRLYKAIAPLEDPSIAFVGNVTVGNAFLASECQGLWAVANMDGKLALPPKEEKEQDVALVNAWCKRRYLYKGRTGTWFYFDTVAYADSLITQLGLSSHKKSWYEEIYAPRMAEDVRPLLREYLHKQGLDEKARKDL